MVSYSRTPSRSGQLRPLNYPKQIEVVVEGDRPTILGTPPHHHCVERIQDTWIIDDEWWRDPISRQYFQVLLEGGVVCTIFHDRTSGTWFIQHY